MINDYIPYNGASYIRDVAVVLNKITIVKPPVSGEAFTNIDSLRLGHG